MSLNAVFKSMKQNTGSALRILPKLDIFLMQQSIKSNDRAFNVNSPSQIGKCLRARYYDRVGGFDKEPVEPRTQRIFDNGHYTHSRLQKYFTDMGILLMEEVPVQNKEHNIQGHTDGIIKVNDTIAILEIKSINDNGFTNLKSAKDDHIQQAYSYTYCLEQRRLYLKETYSNKEAFNKSLLKRVSYYKSFYQHLKDGSKYTRKEKINFQVSLMKKLDNILFNIDTPITKVVFVYENKNSQEIKEFWCDTTTEPKIINNILQDCIHLEKCISSSTVPERDGTSKSCNTCRWCGYKDECWVV